MLLSQIGISELKIRSSNYVRKVPSDTQQTGKNNYRARDNADVRVLFVPVLARHENKPIGKTLMCDKTINRNVRKTPGRLLRRFYWFNLDLVSFPSLSAHRPASVQVCRDIAPVAMELRGDPSGAHDHSRRLLLEWAQSVLDAGLRIIQRDGQPEL